MIFGSRTNGSVMRTLPVGLVATSEEEAESLSRKVSSFTHMDKEALDACSAVSLAVYSLLNGKSKEEVLKAVPKKYLEGELWPSVDALESTRCAFCIFRDSNSYLDAVTKACRLGGDSDTIGAIAGGLCGALYGLDAVPKKWREMLEVKDRIMNAGIKITG
jgi:ADP-ribosyl-[dinitrogen reductase] hydrolase